MNPPYLVRLLLLSSASFFLVQLIVGTLIAFLAPAAIRRAGSMRPQPAARFLLTLRLLPAALSALIVAALCVPSYLRFEPRITEEKAGLLCLAAAILGAVFCALAISRTVAALVRSARYLRACDGRKSCIAGETVWIVKQSSGLALAGILHPRLLLSEAAMRQLTREQLIVALSHERAHRASRDNLKRLLLLLAPAGLHSLEQAWAKYAEWAADDRAAQAESDRSALAEALVRVARLQAGISMPSLVTSLVEADEDLSARVHRLLNAAPVYEANPGRGTIAIAGILLLILSISMSSLPFVHRLLERLNYDLW